ncbi:MAG: pyruvate kinase [Anaerolineae bacterium CG_4_9_14_3_um_filter_57_17]|nr:pyruvate kinase [bacterium]NCT21723.1 pyruvate kinase [bacterium]OIO84555.1 MAG: pyruvate kinase [Anaerolineae bacterium CG2_30_57_67]PJB65542.1 MAG: pyruvate kinase [Anaerolineae bacterium CG_4_9_14_3_um_filter_57_17]
MERRAKIVATIGPSCQDEATLEKLIRAGMNVARLNFSHGTHAEHAERIATIRRIAEKLGVAVGILQDLQGPKIRVGTLDPALELSVGERVTLFAEGHRPPENGDPLLPVAFSEIFSAVAPGNRILLDDGHLALQVEDFHEWNLTAKVIVGGKLSSHKGINLPGTKLTIPGFTEKDRADLAFGLSQSVDFVAISFVRSAEDILTVRQAMEDLDELGVRPPVIAKLEKPEALTNLEEILNAADGVMVARGDLGVEMSPERVPTEQKRIIRQANLHGKMVITATQMLDSMIINPLPTRAEASDVANAIFDGTDAVMLSGETASGAYPVEAVEMMDRIVRQAEANSDEWGHSSTPNASTHDDAASMTRAARELAHDLNVAAVAVFTQSGRTALLMSKARPRVPILAFTPVAQTYGRLSLYWGVFPHLVPMSSTLREKVNQADSKLTATGWVKPGQQVVIISGFPVNTMHTPNMALLHNVGEKM